MIDRSYINEVLPAFYKLVQDDNMDMVGQRSIPDIFATWMWVQTRQMKNPIDVTIMTEKEFCEHFKWEPKSSGER